MTKNETIKRLQARHDCIEKWCKSGNYEECNAGLCDECDLNYEQGNMGEQREALKTAVHVMQTVDLLTDRPCSVCKNHVSNGCIVWECPFDKING